MHNCHEDLEAFHDEKVTLPGDERREMKDRRDANRNRLRDGLDRDGYPQPTKVKSQGSYEHRTMVQDPKKDYDIDDGAYFVKADLTGPRGGELTPAQAKARVRDGLHDQQFSTPPEVRTNCVRVYYQAGYHVDVPVYRIVESVGLFGAKTTRYEIASSTWKESNPSAVTDWFNKANKEQSPDDSNGRQLRRIVRLLKALARSRESWQPRIASGFTITALVVECYRARAGRDDEALYDTIVAMRDRLDRTLEVSHPVVDGELLAKSDDAKTKFLRDKLDWALDQLDVLRGWCCERESALKAWDKVFSTAFFSARLDAASEDATKAAVSSAPAWQADPNAHKSVQKNGGRFA